MKDDPKKSLKDIEKELSSLPEGYLSKKLIKGKERYYLQWNEKGKKKSKYVPEYLLEEVREELQRKKKLKQEAKSLAFKMPRKTIKVSPYENNVIVGEKLASFASLASSFKKRDVFRDLKDFLYAEASPKVGVLYGLRRTGKTTLIRQLILDMKEEDFKKTAFIQADASSSLAKLNRDLRLLYEQGYRYLFLDEVTLMGDFIDGAALFSDIYAPLGMKIILSGTDSLSFYLAESEQLYDRAIFFHTTFIPYREFEDVLGIKGIDEYISYGGTMSLSGKRYNEEAPFSSKKRTDEYSDSSIARNITHSLAFYQNGTHFRALSDLYENDELVNVINRVVEDVNHRFTLEVLDKDFVSSDLAISAKNLRNDRANPNDVLDRIDKEKFTSHLKSLLEILDKDERNVPLEEAVVSEIKEYLLALEVIVDVEVASISKGIKKRYRTLFSQPGLRYAQAKAFAKSLLEDEEFSYLDLEERKAVLERVYNEIKGRMMEEIVLLESKMALKGKEVFELQFSSGEFDMVIFSEESSSCEIFEIKHSKERAEEQYRHLIDPKKLEETEHRYGAIKRRAVIYRGESVTLENGIEYLNVEDYLKSLK